MADSAISTNVVRLPTAARRQVKQVNNAAGRAARKALREENPWPGEFLYPAQRQAMKTAQTLIDLQPTVELELLSAICAALGDDQRAKVIEALGPGVVAGRKAAEKALAVVQSTKMTVGDSIYLSNAMRSLGAN